MDPTSFDRQAPTFDARAGLPDGALAAMARAVAVEVLSPAAGWLVEVGAGTGRLGRRLEEACGAYVAFDGSFEMLSRTTWASAPRVQADGRKPWPFADGSARAVFASRALHLFEPEHAARQTMRLLGPRSGTALLLASRRRAAESVSERLRREMRRRLAKQGIFGKARGRFEKRLFEHCCQQGAAVIEPVAVSSWNSTVTPADAIANWRSKEGLAGRAVSPAVQAEVLEQLTAWAETEFGDLAEPREVTMAYVLTGVRWS
ncbi:MAG: class I SAM-dependent methyltransferase [Acidobacteriota bacterium]